MTFLLTQSEYYTKMYFFFTKHRGVKAEILISVSLTGSDTELKLISYFSELHRIFVFCKFQTFMKYKFVFLISIILVPALSHAQEKDSLEESVINAVKKWSEENDSFPGNKLSQKVIDQLKDSGAYSGNLKEGVWVEYSIDSSNSNQKVKVMIGDKSFDYNPGPTLIKQTGTYKKNKRTGSWITYNSTDTELPVSWSRKILTAYNDGLKNGEEITYQGWGDEYQRPLQVSHFSNGIENGERLFYHDEKPYNLKWHFNVKNGKEISTNEYDESGNIKWAKNDTLLYSIKGVYLKQYDQKSDISQEGFYVNDSTVEGPWKEYYPNGKIKSVTTYKNGLQNGSFKYYYESGQLWTERIYKDDRLMDVISNFNSAGKPNKLGTLKNGTGSVIIYDEKGNITGVKQFRNGNAVD
jgi:antitoxin component YwqK of YwqJK toxin-antitoxin module